MNYGELQANIQDIVENTFPAATIAMFVRQAEQRIYNFIQFPSLRKNVTGTLTPNNKYLSAPNDFLSVYSLAVFLSASTTATGTSGELVITVANADKVRAGQYVSGTGIGTGALVRQVVGTTVYLTVPNSGTVSGTINFQSEYKYLLNKDVNFIREAYPYASVTGQPKHYAIFGPSYSETNELSFILGPTPDLSYDAELHYYYYPISIVQSAISTLGTLTNGSSYTNGTYFNVPLTGGNGSGATAKIVVSGNAVTSVSIQNPGVFYAVNDSLSAAASDIGGTGSGFAVTVSAVSNATGTSWLGDNFDLVLLNGSLVEAARFMKAEPETIANYDKLFMEAAGLAKQLGDGKQRMDAYRDGQFRMKVS